MEKSENHVSKIKIKRLVTPEHAEMIEKYINLIKEEAYIKGKMDGAKEIMELTKNLVYFYV